MQAFLDTIHKAGLQSASCSETGVLSFHFLTDDLQKIVATVIAANGQNSCLHLTLFGL
jgi:hypothetical protein